MVAMIRCLYVLAWVMMGQVEPAEDTAGAATATDSVTIQLQQGRATSSPEPQRFSVRFTGEELRDLVELRQGVLSPQLELESQRKATGDALERISMAAVLHELSGHLQSEYEGRFDPGRDVIFIPIDASRKVTIDTPDLSTPTHTGPQSEPLGFLIHDLTEPEFRSLALRIIQMARLLLDSGNPEFDRTTGEYVQALAAAEVDALRSAIQQQEQDAAYQTEVRHKVAQALGLLQSGAGQYTGDPQWQKESRRFSYIVREGQFISRLKPLVDRINREMEIAGFPSPGVLTRPGIHFDPEIGDVDIMLPKPMLNAFLEQADAYERRMAEDAVISIEAVRLTDREIISAALASRLNAQVQGVHEPTTGYSNRRVLREAGLNSLLAIANRELQVRTLEGVAAGTLPAGVNPVQIAAPSLPPLVVAPESTLVGSNFSIGADDIFFDGREQVTGFSYVGPDGVHHELSIQTVDSLRETWERIERNLIVHKIKKTDNVTTFSVPVGPETKVYQGIAALISQEKQTLIVSSGNAVERTDATAGTWLVIEDFDISPIPGSSTTLTEEERELLGAKVMLTMFLRDPFTDADFKRQLLDAPTSEDLYLLLRNQLESIGARPIRPGRQARSYRQIYDERYAKVIEDEGFIKKEKNSLISLTFYSSQGNIVQSPGTGQLGDANDLTSFTTMLRPNVVTPISSFFTKGGTETTGTSPLTGIDKGERTDQNKTMTHLVIRTRFPTIQREDQDRAEGRFTGYFELPINREPDSQVDLPFLSSSEHPVQRLAKLRFGLMFASLDGDRIRKPFANWNPQKFPGDVSKEAWETATTRVLFNRKLISDSPNADITMASDYGDRFITEVRSLLEYDEDFFEAPGFALRNMTQWNDPDRIALALNSSPKRFALERLIEILDELGTLLIPDDVAENYLAYCPRAGWGDRKIYPLTQEQLRSLRRDVALHRMRFQEYYGDAFLEAASLILQLGAYSSKEVDPLLAGPFRGYHDLVVFDNSGSRDAEPELYEAALRNFLFLKAGGHKGKLFEPSMLSLEHLEDDQRDLIYRGTDILTLANKAPDYDRWTRR